MKQYFKGILFIMTVIMVSGIAAANLSGGITITESISEAGSAIITILGNITETHERYIPYVDAGATAIDSATGNEVPVTTIGTPRVNIPGNYNITYSAIGGDGTLVTANRTVRIIDTTPPNNVTNLAVTATTLNSISIAWTIPNKANYPNQDYAGVVLTVSNTTSVLPGYNKLSLGNVSNTTITGLTSNTAYIIRIQSADDQEAMHPGNGT